MKSIDLLIVGSTLTGLASDESDLDLCVVVEDSFDLRVYRTAVLRKIESLLEKNVSKIELMNARVLVLRFFSSQYRIAVEMNCNNLIGIRNTRLLYCYRNIEIRFAPLLLIIKKWAKTNFINESHFGTLSSYAIQLMPWTSSTSVSSRTDGQQ